MKWRKVVESVSYQVATTEEVEFMLKWSHVLPARLLDHCCAQPRNAFNGWSFGLLFPLPLFRSDPFHSSLSRDHLDAKAENFLVQMEASSGLEDNV